MKQVREKRTLRLKGSWPKGLRLAQGDPNATQTDTILPSHESAADPIGRDAIARAARTLRRHQMPPEEISAVLDSDDPELVRRYMELHREWLEERLADELRTLTGLERFLVQAIDSRGEGPDRRSGNDPRAVLRRAGGVDRERHPKSA